MVRSLNLKQNKTMEENFRNPSLRAAKINVKKKAAEVVTDAD